jgi:nitrate reductase NapAB chaperone NapD
MGIGLTLMVTTWTSFGWSQEPQLISSTSHQKGTLLCGKAARTPAQKKISSLLLYELKKRRGEAISREFETLETSIEVDSNGQTLVDIKAEVNETVLSRIQALEGKVISSFAQYQAIRARIPIEKIEVLAELPEVISIRPAERPINN